MPFPLLAQAFSLFHFSPSPEEEEGKGGIFIFPPHYIQYVRFHPPQIPKNWWHTFNIFSVNEMKWNLELENFMPFWTSNFWKWGLSKCQSVILFRRAAPFLCVTNKLFHSSRGCWVLSLSIGPILPWIISILLTRCWTADFWSITLIYNDRVCGLKPPEVSLSFEVLCGQPEWQIISDLGH